MCAYFQQDCSGEGEFYNENIEPIKFPIDNPGDLVILVIRKSYDSDYYKGPSKSD